MGITSFQVLNFSTEELIERIESFDIRASTPVEINTELSLPDWSEEIDQLPLIVLLSLESIARGGVDKSIIGLLLKYDQNVLNDVEIVKRLVLNASLKLLPYFNFQPSNAINQREIIISMILNADVHRILVLNKINVIQTEEIVETLKHPNLLIHVCNCLYMMVVKHCRKYEINREIGELGLICELEKKYINLFRFVKSNGIELSQVVNISNLIQIILNSYLFQLIKYFIDNLKPTERDNLNIDFYHYSNFPINNKIILKSIYNETNFARILAYLKESLFLKRVIKKKIGRKILPLSAITDWPTSVNMS